MERGSALACTLLFSFSCLVAQPGFAAQQTWTKARSGAFEAVSDNGKRSATQALSQFEQFRYALGTVLGKPDLKLDPAIRIVLFRNQAELDAQSCPDLQQGRERLNVCAVADAQLPPATLRALTKQLLENNFAAMPAGVEQALITFFSTVESKAVRVSWGAPPPPAERSLEWAMVHRIVTQPDYAGKARIFLHNLASGMDRPSAIRNAFGEDAAKFEAETRQYFQAGVFAAAPAPSRPINPDHDFTVADLTSDEGTLMRADLLTPKSADLYRELLAQGKQKTEANEGLGLLAMRDGDVRRAREHFEKALDGGSRNVVMITAYAGTEGDSARAVKLCQDAIAIDPKYAPARWLLGEQTNDPRMHALQWKQATALAPRKVEWWVLYARFCLEQKQYAEAGRAWLAAAQAAPDYAKREEYLAARGRIDEQRLDSEEEVRKRESDTQAREIEQLKTQARKEIADLEAKANRGSVSSKDPVFEWSEINGATVSGILNSTECTGRQFRLHVTTLDGRNLVLLVRDASKIDYPAERVKFSCAAQKPRSVSVTYKPSSQGNLAGEVTSIEPR